MKNKNIKTLAALALATPMVACNKAEKQPNIVLFLIDDMGWTDSSVAFGEEVYPGNLRYNTPNMERLAEQGVIMTQAYVSSTSSPTRNSIMTGMNSAHSRHTNYGAKFKDTPTDGGDHLHVLENDCLERTNWNYNGIDPTGTTNNATHVTPFPQLLKDDGYYTIHIGKAHWAPGGTPAASPLNMGFCVNVGGQIVGRANSYYGEDNYGNKAGIWTLHATHNMAEYYGSNINLTEALTLEALKTLDYPIQQGIPFFLNFCHHGVHTPIQSDPRFVQKYLDAGMDKGQAGFASMIEGIDKSLGDLMDYLEAKGVADNTMIVFMSDNGGDSITPEKGGVAHTCNLPLKEGKGSVYEGGIRIPMIIAWGKKTAHGTRINTPVMAEDLFPTFLDMAGIEGYKTVQEIDGKSLVALLTDGSHQVRKAMDAGEITSQKEANAYRIDASVSGIEPDREVVLHFPHQWKPWVNDDIDYMSAMRKGDWKIIYRHRPQTLELYNLADDLGESHNLAAEQPEKLAEMAKGLSDRLRGWEALMPTVKATGKPIAWPDELAK